MSETHWWEHANRGIIGLGPEPWEARDRMGWPTAGYDGTLTYPDWDAADERPADPFAITGRTPDEWVALADEMIRRWSAFRAHITTLAARPTP